MEKNKKLIIAVIIIIFFLFPFKGYLIRDGGSRTLEPILPIYKVYVMHQLYSASPLMAHDDPDYQPPTEVTYLKGYKIYIFGHLIADNTYLETEPIRQK